MKKINNFIVGTLTLLSAIVFILPLKKRKQQIADKLSDYAYRIYEKQRGHHDTKQGI